MGRKRGFGFAKVSGSGKKLVVIDRVPLHAGRYKGGELRIRESREATSVQVLDSKHRVVKRASFKTRKQRAAFYNDLYNYT